MEETQEYTAHLSLMIEYPIVSSDLQKLQGLVCTNPLKVGDNIRVQGAVKTIESIVPIYCKFYLKSKIMRLEHGPDYISTPNQVQKFFSMYAVGSVRNFLDVFFRRPEYFDTYSAVTLYVMRFDKENVLRGQSV
jgi:hypothetical protein